MLSIQKHLSHYLNVWENASSDFPCFDKTFTRQNQNDSALKLDAFQAKITSMHPKHVKKGVDNASERIFPHVKAFLKDTFNIPQKQLELILSDEFTAASKAFYFRARAFGPELKPTHIYQAMRNVWIMNQLQLMLHQSVRITPSVFAYSMIYPYSDNYLDHTKVTPLEKELFSKHLKQKLKGHHVEPHSHHEKQLYILIEMFEQEFDRNKFPEVYQSLYAIQKGQTQSLHLIKAQNVDAHEISRICFEKGGASVLADGYLVAGTLTPQEQLALFGYGVYLQLLDDLQDLDEDAAANTHTMFSFAKKNELARMVNKTIHFGRTVLKDMQCFKGKKNPTMLALMKHSIETMAIEAVGLHAAHYPADYVKKLEHYSPFHFAYVRKKRSQSKSQRFGLLQRYFDAQSTKLATEFVS